MTEHFPLMVPGAPPAPQRRRGVFALRRLAAGHGRASGPRRRGAGAGDGRRAVPRPRRLAQPGRADRHSAPGGRDHAGAPPGARRRGRPRGRQALDRFAGRGRSGDRRRPACAPSICGRQAGSEIPMNRNAASAGRAGLHAVRADRRGVGLQRLQPSAEHDRSPGGPGRGGRLPGDRQAGGGHAAVVLAIRADLAGGRPARGVVPTAGDGRSSTRRGHGGRPAGGLLQLRRQRQSGLGAPRRGWPRARAARWSMAAWRR